MYSMQTNMPKYFSNPYGAALDFISESNSVHLIE